MSYARTPELVAALNREWIEVKALNDFIATAELNSFMYVSGRTATIEMWGKLPRVLKAGPTARFGDWDTWVCVSDGDWPGKIRTMLSSLNYKEASEQGRVRDETDENQLEGKAPPRGKNSDPEPHRPKDSTGTGQAMHEKAMLGFFTSLQRMRDQLAKGDNVYDQTAFEKTFNAVWSA